MTTGEIEDEIHRDLREIAFYYGGWEKLREVIAILEDNDNEAAFERYTKGEADAWEGGFADNH